MPLKKTILLAATGSVASVKFFNLAEMLGKNHNIITIGTKSALHFLEKSPDFIDKDEWKWKHVGEPILHIELRKQADLLLIAPLSANTLAKIANGVCNNLVTSVARCWDFSKPFVVAPAMNTYMWAHPCTIEQIQKLQQWGVHVVDPACKKLACGDIGIGALADIEEITKAVQEYV